MTKKINLQKLLPDKMTILRKFLLGRLEHHVPVTRKGSDPNTRQAGFSTEKFLAAQFLGTTRLPQKSISIGLSVSYDTCRQWASEPAFKAAAADAGDSFARSCAGYLRTVAGNQSAPEHDPLLADVNLFHENVVSKLPPSFFGGLSLTDLLAMDPAPIFDFVVRHFGPYHEGVGEAWRRHYALATVAKFRRENQTAFLFSREREIALDRVSLDMTFSIVEEYLGDWKE